MVNPKEGIEISRGSIKTPPEINHQGALEHIRMTKDRMEVILERFKAKPKKPSWENILIPVGFAITGMLTLTTSTFKDTAWGDAAFWKAMTVIITWSSAICTVIFGVVFAWKRAHYKEKSCKQEVLEIMKELDDEEKSAIAQMSTPK